MGGNYLSTIAIVPSIWINVAMEERCTAEFALGVLGISAPRILCTYRKYYVVFSTKSK